jgi:hypothetical protein
MGEHLTALEYLMLDKNARLYLDGAVSEALEVAMESLSVSDETMRERLGKFVLASALSELCYTGYLQHVIKMSVREIITESGGGVRDLAVSV